MGGEVPTPLWGRQGLLRLDAAGRLYTRRLVGGAPDLLPMRGHFLPMLVPGAVRDACAADPLAPETLASCDTILRLLLLPLRIRTDLPSHVGWLRVDLERDGEGILTW